ncbi:MAG: glycoside hydrolase family 78 protein [Dysgonamonadaceae bacterium]|nr:glycoside hydrolase family 78 protein [Dysgonamonadaceae bacterium]
MLIFLTSACSEDIIKVTDLRCEYLTDPLGIDVDIPRLSWKITNTKSVRSQRQTGYRILIASSADKLKEDLADVWDSKLVASNESNLIPVKCGSLKHSQNYFWKVKAYDKDGKESKWSSTARFSTGLKDSADWQGKWIKHPTANSEKHIWFRKEINIDKKPSTVFAYVASQGYHEIYINGRKADERVLAPAVSRNDKRVLYVTYDITPLLKKGTNVISVWYGPGWTRNNYFSRLVNQALLVQIYGTTTNGGTFVLSTDETWKCAESYSSNAGGFSFMDMGGETVDGTLYTDDWNKPGFDETWINAAEVNPLKQEGKLTLSAQMTDVSLITKTIRAKSVTDSVPGFYRVDMGEHFTGYLDAKFNGLKRGDTVQITISEKTYATWNGENMNPSGRTGDHAIEDHRQRQIYIARGENGETFRNRFNFFSGRYVHFKGLPAAPEINNITGYAISSAPQRTAKFESSNTLYNRIFEADLHTFEMCHTEGVIVDCPNRERLGYGPEGAYQTTWGLGLPCFESGAYYVKNIRDWADVQRPDGFINNVAPQISIMYGCALNGTANMNIAWEHFNNYGDTAVLRAVQPVGKRWLEYLSGYVKDNMLTRYDRHGYFLGDWVSPGPVFEYAETEEALYFNNCVYAIALDHYINICSQIGLYDEVSIYKHRLNDLRKALHEKYYDAEKNIYLNGDQVRTTCALYAGIVPDSLHKQTLQHLAGDLQSTHPYINVGSFGRYPFYKTIIANGDLYETFDKILSKTTYPSYGYFISNGCNVFPETWEIAHSNCAQTHTSYLGISAWLLKGIAGIEPEIQHRVINITPHTVKGLTFARAETGTPYGTVHSAWLKEPSGGTTYEITVPVGLRANITLPAPLSNITDNGKLLQEEEGIINLSGNDGKTVIRVEAGYYRLEVKDI